MPRPRFNIDARHVAANAERAAARKKVGVDIAFFFPGGTLIVNAATPEQEELWARKAGEYAMPELIREAMADQLVESARIGADEMASNVTTAIKRIWPEESAEMLKQINAELRKMQKEE
jgi:hypothetical protein